jgi:hypothetical protein
MACSPRAAALDELAALIAAIDSPRPIHIVLDGRTASGETTLADGRGPQREKIGAWFLIFQISQAGVERAGPIAPGADDSKCSVRTDAYQSIYKSQNISSIERVFGEYSS